MVQKQNALWYSALSDRTRGKRGAGDARIFRQNMFNCGILAVELAKSGQAAGSNADGKH
jgi:hypothetical protein